MAYDKIVDSAALDGALTGIADAIRGKTGSTEKLTLEGMATAIAGIQTGGASGIYMAQVTPAENVTNIKVQHNLGTTDILLAACWAESLGAVTPEDGQGLAHIWAKTDVPNQRGGNGFQSQILYDLANNRAQDTGIPSSSVYWDNVVDENTFRFNPPGFSSSTYVAGLTYTIVIVAANAEV